MKTRRKCQYDLQKSDCFEKETTGERMKMME